MYNIKQSTAITVPFFVHDASGDAVTGLSDGSFTKRISKNGGAFGAMTVTITEMENGWYSIPLSTSHSDTVGLLSITFTNAGAKQVNLQWRVEAKLVDDLNDVAATDIVSAGAITTSSGAVSSVTTVTTNSDMRGTDNALLAASAPSNFGDMAITVTTGRVTVGTNNDKTGYALSAAGVDAVHDEVVEGTLTFRQMVRVFLAALGGKSAGGGTATLTFRDNADGKDRITATVDADGNRTAMTLDGS